MFENDYIMKQIELMTNFRAKVILGKESPEYKLKYDLQGNASDEELLYLRLVKMIDDGEINEAENLLFENIEREPRAEYLEIAIDFYDRLGRLDNKALDDADFSRAEVLEGLENVKKLYGIETP